MELAFSTTIMALKSATKSTPANQRPKRLSQVNAFLRQHGIAGVELRRGRGYFDFWGMPIAHWLNRSVLVDRLEELSLQQWLDKYRELERQNRPGVNPLTGRPLRSRRIRT